MKTKKISKALENRINEILEMSKQVDKFYCDFDSTIIYLLWDLKIKYNDRFVWISYDGNDKDNKHRFNLNDECQVDGLKFTLTHLRKGIKSELKYR